MTGILGGLIGSFKTAVVGLVNKYFISVQSSTPKYTLSSVAVDSNQNTYYATYGGSTERSGFLLLKKAKDGSIVWVKNISSGYTASGPGDAIYGIKIIGSDLWAWGSMRVDPSRGNDTWIIKFDLNGSIVSQWYQNWNTGSVYVDLINFEIDSSGYFHLTFSESYLKSSGYYDLIFTSNLSVSAVKKRDYSFGSPNQILSRPSDGTVFYSVNDIGNWINLVTPGTAPTTDTKYSYTTTDASAYPTQNNRVSKFIFDSSGNIYVLSYVVTTSSIPNPSYFLISKFNTSLVNQWTRKIASSTSSINAGTVPRSLAIDSSANIYILLQYTSSTYATILKYNSSGTLQWKSRLAFTSGGTSQTPPGGNLIVDSNNDLIWQGNYGSGTVDGVILKIKPDGSLANGTARTIPGTSPAIAVTISTDSTYIDSTYASTVAFTSSSTSYIGYSGASYAYTTTMPYSITNTDVTASYTENIYSTT